MYDGGNYINTNLATSIAYTNRVVTASDTQFGAGSRYFTAKYTGLFVMAATDISISSFSITGNLGADGGGARDGAVLSTTVNGSPYTLYVKRVYSAGDPSVNHIIIVPGNGAGVSHTYATSTDDDQHTVNGLSSVRQLYYLLTARASGAYLANADVLNIANEFLANIGQGLTHSVVLGPGETVVGINFGNHSENIDFGDAPAPYPTLSANSGAQHSIVAGFHLGSTVDADGDGQPNADATLDDTTGTPDDEDGVVFATPCTSAGMRQSRLPPRRLVSWTLGSIGTATASGPIRGTRSFTALTCSRA